ncbi:MAG: signal peptidase I [Bacilli bacterium]|nr:signal peptidase I [Bacilli bacterium]
MHINFKNIFEKIMNTTLNVLIFLFAIILVITIYTSFQTKVLKNDYNNFFGYSLFEVQTGSMSPTIEAGDWIIVKITNNVKLDDIVTYKLGNDFVTHRVIEGYSDTFVTKGDANNAKDDPITKSQIVGRVTKILSSFGIFRKTLFNPGVLITLILTLFTINFVFKKDNDFMKKLSLIKNKLFKEKKVDEEVVSKKVVDNSVKVDDKVKVLVDDKSLSNEDLEKTSLFRVVSVDEKEVDVDTLNNMKQSINESSDDLEKTSLYRMISVDSEEVKDTLLEIAKNELKESNGVVAIDEKEEDPKEEEKEVELKLELFKKKKSKNVIDLTMIIMKNYLEEVTNIILKNNKSIYKESVVRNAFIDLYINVKYRDLQLNSEISGRILSAKIAKNIKLLSIQLVDDYVGKNKNYAAIVDIYKNTFLLINDLEKASDSITDYKVKKEFYIKELAKYYNEDPSKEIEYIYGVLIKTKRTYNSVIDETLKKFETNMFNLVFNRLSLKKDIYCLKLEHNINFSKVYSDYVIDKTYNEGVVAEDKVLVLLNLLSLQLLKDMRESYFNRKYVFYLPDTLYKKAKKIESTLKMIDDAYAKENVFILIKVSILNKNKKIIQALKKEGFKFVGVIDVDLKNKPFINVLDYIFCSKDEEEDIRNYVPEDLRENIICEDITDKLGDFGGEE